jgi:hypothetical protein
MKGLQLSRIGGRWAIGPVQQWWLALDDLHSRPQATFGSGMAGRTERLKLQAQRQTLYEKFPACSNTSAPTAVAPTRATAEIAVRP